ncbi:MAG: hypothetical protein EPO40_00525 [Myxococcaceae bacterium]|nr:MAG: hypothetical protein EPO40_00525 [Myxococcaceae bacterium]
MSGPEDEVFDLAILGAGSAGLTGADFAAKLGVRVALIEKHRIGGDCTWTGCVPSKALIKSARIAHEVRRAAGFGIDAGPPRADMGRVRDRIRATIASVYEHERPEALRERGITVIEGAAAFVDAHTIAVGERRITAGRAVVCTGARPATPPVPGLAEVGYVTYETFFDNDLLPAHLLVLGAGPIGLEMAQAYRRLGAEVTVIGEQLLPREEPEARAVVERVLAREGLRCLQGRVEGARRDGATITLSTSAGDVSGTMLLVATGRRPNVHGLGLDRAGVEHSDKGVVVDACLRTSVHHIYAAGDVIGGPQFTHLAGWQCFQAVRNALLPGNARGIATVLPAVTFLDPEVARVGASEAEARATHGEGIRVHHWQMSSTDRAQCDGDLDGFVKVVCAVDRTILGATIVAARAGEMIGEFALAVQRRLTLADLAATIHAYPTWSMAVQQLASEVAVGDFLGSTSGRLATRLGAWLR